MSFPHGAARNEMKVVFHAGKVPDGPGGQQEAYSCDEMKYGGLHLWSPEDGSSHHVAQHGRRICDGQHGKKSAHHGVHVWM
jgi:hypothetical protein